MTMDNRLSERLDALTPAQREALLNKLKSKASQENQGFSLLAPIVKSTRTSTHAPLSAGQQSLWFLEQLSPGEATYHIASRIRLKGSLDVAKLRAAVDKLMERHAILRSRYQETLEGIRQQQLQHMDTPLTVLPQNDSIQSILDRHVDEAFSLTEGPLFRIGLFTESEHSHILSLVMHHSISDAWSCQLMLVELASLYNDVNAPLAKLSCQYADFSAWQQDALQSAAIDKQRHYWKTQLHTIEPIALPCQSLQGKRARGKGKTQRLRLNAQQVEALKALSHSHQATLFHGLMAGFQALLYRYTEQTNIAIGTPVAGRNHPDTQGLIGFFVNSLAIVTDASSDISFNELIQAVKDTTLKAQSHQDIPFEAVVDALEGARQTTSSPVFQTFFSYNPDNHQQLLFLEGLEAEFLTVKQHTAKFDLSLIVQTTESGLDCLFEYPSALFDDCTIIEMIEAFERLLVNACTAPNKPLSELALLSETKQQALLALTTGSAPLNQPLSIIEQFEQQAIATPDKLAVMDDQHAIGFKALNQQANSLALRLQAEGIQAGDKVAIHLPKTIAAIASLLAVAKLQATYVPIDLTLPSERKAFIIQHANIKIVLSETPLASALAHIDPTQVESNDTPFNRPSNDSPEQVFYLLYTSGSTGNPKGAKISEGSARHLYAWYLNQYQMSTDDNVLVFSSLGFDLTQKNLWTPLLSGATLHLTEQPYYDPAALSQRIHKDNISWLNCAPSALYPIIDHSSDFAALASLAKVFVGGEPVDIKRLTPWLNHDTTVANLINMYGPTECTDISSVYTYQSGDTQLPIGKPIAGVSLYVLDGHQKMLPQGAIGELCISGVSLGLGYHENSELNTKRFCSNPYANNSQTEQLYRTGDLVRLNPEGQLEFIARNDGQMKIHGIRLDPEDVESVLRALPNIDDAAVALKTVGEHKARIAYLCTADPTHSAAYYKRQLTDKLNDQAIPRYFVKIDKIPTNTNGKVDRKALPAPDVNSNAAPFVPPSNAIEAELVSIWQRLLGVPQVSINDEFFQLGGNSLLATQLLIRIREQFFIDLPMRTLFEVSTLESLAEIIFAMQGGEATATHDEALEEGIL